MKSFQLQNRQPNLLRRGFTLLEVLVGVVVLGIVTGGILMYVGSAQQNVADAKLQSDVLRLNSAVVCYIANGGSIPDDLEADEVLGLLKSRHTDEVRERHVGISGELVDPRISPVYAKAGGVGADTPVVLWDDGKKRFVLGEGEPGILRFENKGDGTPSIDANRGASSVQYAANSNWVWDYQEFERSGTPSSFSTANLPGTPLPTPNTPTGPPGTPTTPTPTGPVTPLILDAPTFSIPAGNYPLVSFDLAVHILAEDSIPGTYEIWYSKNSSSFAIYEGNAIAVAPKDTLIAYSVSIDPDRFSDSPFVSATYEAIPVQLEIAGFPSAPMVSYYDVSTGNTRAFAALENQSEIPGAFRDNNSFSLNWNATQRTPQMIEATWFGEYATQQLDLSTGDWNPSLGITVQAISKVPELISSEVATIEVGIEKLPLPTPTVSLSEGAEGEYAVTIDTGGTLPPGAEIHYRTSGNALGDPSGWSRYSSAFDMVLDFEEEESEEENEVQPPPSAAVVINQVKLTHGGVDVVQNQSQNSVIDASDSPVTIEEITFRHGEKVIVADEINTSDFGVTRIGSFLETWNIWVGLNGSVVPYWFPDFEEAAGTALSSGDVRQYISSSRRVRTEEYDLTFSAPLRSSDYLVVMERWGNSNFELTPLAENGGVISGSTTVSMSPPYHWNTGYAPSDVASQAMEFSVIPASRFGVTGDDEIRGFRVVNLDGADYKFFMISDEPFVEPERVWDDGTIVAKVVPSEPLSLWFEDSEEVETAVVVD